MASNIDDTVPVTGNPTTSSVRTQFTTAKSEITALQDDKAPIASPTFTGTTNISASWTVGGTAITASAAEINHLDGVTSGIQGQINAKAPIASPTLTGTVNVTTLQIGSWTIVESGGKLMFRDNSNNRFSIDSVGNIVADGNVTAFGSP